MYVTRPLSQLLKYPETVEAPPDGPNSGYLVIQDEESETYSCFGLYKNTTLKDLPFPQNKELTVRYVTHSGETTHVSLDPLFLIPVLSQPLSSNRYYAIVPHKKRIGYEGLCSMKDEFVAKSMASDGYPPYFLRRKGWSIYTKTPHNFNLFPAQGLDSKLRARLPELGSESHVVGKWYTPFVFVKDGSLKDQVKQSMYYDVTLEQKWEKVFSCRKNSNENSVVIDALIENEQVFVGGNKAVWNEKSVADGVVWFTTNGPGTGVGLRVELVERMKWEEERGGWVGAGAGEEKGVKISKVEEFKEGGKWSEFGCYVLVERFNLKRMDGSLVMYYDFKHLNQMKTKWE